MQARPSPMPKDFYAQFDKWVESNMPSIKKMEANFASSFISPFCYELSVADFKTCQAAVKSFTKLRSNTRYQEWVRSQDPILAKISLNPASLFMGYDFHMTANGPRLIEINTNAGFAFGQYYTHLFRKDLGQISDDEQKKLDAYFCLNSAPTQFLHDLRLELETLSQTRQLKDCVAAIVDRNPSEQALFFEFLLFQDLFKLVFKDCLIIAPEKLRYNQGQLESFDGQKIDFAYNRHTDFYLRDDDSKALREALENQKVTCSPNPLDFAILADKKRMIDFSKERFLETFLSDEDCINIRRVLIKSHLVSDWDANTLWAERKNYFFKPFESFGGRAVYAGKGITRKVWGEILAHPYLAQESVPAPHLTFEGPQGTLHDFKFDLRFYSYGEQIRIAAPRLYQGQTTNFRTPLGGFGGLLMA